MDTKKFVEILDKHVDQEALVKELLIEIVFPKLDALVKDTATPFDDVALTFLKEHLLK